MSDMGNGTSKYLETVQHIFETKEIPPDVSLPIVMAGQVLIWDAAKEAQRIAGKQDREVFVHRLALIVLGVSVAAAYGFSIWDWAKLATLVAH